MSDADTQAVPVAPADAPGASDAQGKEAKGGSILGAWPAILITIGIFSAAIYSFSPRPDPFFPATEVNSGGLLINGLDRLGRGYVAVGEQGQILTSTKSEGPWKEAQVKPQRGSTFTDVQVLDLNTAVAVGHDSWIVRTTNGGRTWNEVYFDPDRSEPLMGIEGPFEGKLYAFGAFGQWLISEDGGEIWSRSNIEAAAEEEGEAAYDPTTDPESDQYDPFAAFSTGAVAEDFTTRHLNNMARAGDGSYFLVGERGLILQSKDGAETWKKLEDIYSGSFYGAIPVGRSSILVHGMRGNAFLSPDLGETWIKSRIAEPRSLFGGMVLDNGDILLAGSGNAVFVSQDGGRSFRKKTDKGANTIATVLPLPQGAFLTGGDAGLQVQNKPKKKAKKGGRS